MSNAQLLFAGQALIFMTAVISAIMTFWGNQKVHELHLLINSRLDELLKAAKSLAFAEGIAKGIAEERKDSLEPKK